MRALQDLRRIVALAFGSFPWLFLAAAAADAPTRCEIVPLANHEVSFRIDGREVTRWHFGNDYPRPFFFPFRGPSGESLTRMGHPGAPNHDHHRSVWFAHHRVEGSDFWSDQTAARVRQKHWYAYQDGNREAIMATHLGWYDGSGSELMAQDVVAAVLPLDGEEWALELQLTFRPGEGREQVKLEKTNFGFLAIRVSKSLSGFFGDGLLSDSEGRQSEQETFGKRSRWMDYSGSVAAGDPKQRSFVQEGITYFDHPDNPRYPTHWHVREDGWMGAAFGFADGLTISHNEPLTLRYLLLAHRGGYDSSRAAEVTDAFSKRSGFVIRKSTRRHRQYEVLRSDALE